MNGASRERMREILRRYLAGEKVESEVRGASDEWEAGYLNAVSAMIKYGFEKAFSAPSPGAALRELKAIARNPMLNDFTRGFLAAWMDALRLTTSGGRGGSSGESRRTARG